METKKLVRQVSIPQADGSFYRVGEKDVVSIIFSGNTVEIYFRSEEEKVENSTPRKMQDRPMKCFSGFAFIVEDILQ